MPEVRKQKGHAKMITAVMLICMALTALGFYYGILPSHQGDKILALPKAPK